MNSGWEAEIKIGVAPIDLQEEDVLFCSYDKLQKAFVIQKIARDDQIIFDNSTASGGKQEELSNES